MRVAQPVPAQPLVEAAEEVEVARAAAQADVVREPLARQFLRFLLADNPVRALKLNELAGCTKPKLIVQGTNDEFGPMAQLNSWYADLPEPKRLVRIEGADHFFEGRREEMAKAIVDYFSEV